MPNLTANDNHTVSFQDYEILMSYSQIMADPERNVVCFQPYAGFEKVVSEVVEKKKLKNLSMEQFQEMAAKFQPLFATKRKLTATRIRNFENMTTKEIADLPLESKVDYIESLFYVGQTRDELDSLCSTNGDKLKALLSNITFPKEFWKKEEALATRFSSLVCSTPQITEGMKNWQNISLDDKKAVIQETAKVIEYVYGAPIEIGFFTPEEYRKQNNLDDKAHVFGAYAENGKIFFNTERLEGDNFMGVSVLFHEFMHKRQHETDFGNPLINRLFDSKVYRAHSFEQQETNPTSQAYGDFYALMLHEVHAYAMQKFVEDQIVEKTGIYKIQENTSDTSKNMHEKAFAMSAVAKCRSIY